ncbi:MAG: hypothetical protein QF441_13190 [Bacteriovoracaceae bacterium]|nr:hypothetical protein [Halobacteriovoraceae bacterium]MDP7321560.1 hypothetical protein [Bacteriovoracaceae bacterium]
MKHILKFSYFISIIFFTPSIVFAKIDCSKKYSDNSYDAFSQEFFDANYKELPLYITSFISNSIDTNQNQIIESEEAKTAACQLSKSLLQFVNKPSNIYINQAGEANLYDFLANDQKITSGEELRISLGVIAQNWLKTYIKKINLLETEEALLNLIDSGYYTVSTPNAITQFDVAGKDGSALAKIEKSLMLANAIENILQKSQGQASKILRGIFEVFVDTKNFPYIAYGPYISSQKIKINLEINQLSEGAGTGIPGAQRYYLLKGLGITLDIFPEGDTQITFGRTKEQNWFVLRHPRFMQSETSPFVSRIDKKLAQISKQNQTFLLLNSKTVLTKDLLQDQLQSLLNDFADAFWRDPINLVIKEQLEGGANAYLTDGKIFFSFNNLKHKYKLIAQRLSEEKTLQQITRHIYFILTQEWIHSLQKDESTYTENFMSYNNAYDAYLAYGYLGINEWYNGQMIENDAKKSARKFVKSLKFSHLSSQ